MFKLCYGKQQRFGYLFGKNYLVYFFNNICEYLLGKNIKMRYSEELDDMIFDFKKFRV